MCKKEGTEASPLVSPLSADGTAMSPVTSAVRLACVSGAAISSLSSTCDGTGAATGARRL